MNMSKDLSRQIDRKTRHWQRILKEKAYQRKALADHSKEYSSLLDEKQERARQRDKIDQMRRH